MGFLKNLFVGGKLSLKRKEGGTVVGNFLREVINGKTAGQFGNGNLMLKPGETPGDANARAVQAAGVGAKAFNDALPNDADSTQSPQDNFTKGVIMEKIKKAAPLLLGIIVAIFLGFKIFKKK